MPTQHRMAAGLLAALLSLAAPAAPPSPFDHASSAAAQASARADTLATPRHAVAADTRAAPRAPAAYALATPRRAPAADTLALVDAVFARWNGSASPGCAAGVSRGGRIALARAWGMADLEHGVPNTTGTVFEAGSVSKQFTAAAVILLEQQGRLSLGDDVRRWIPELPDYGTTITIRQLLDHTSGLRDWGSVAAIAGWPRGERTHSHDHVLEILARQRALNYAPGSEYSYTNSGYNLAVIIVERASGESFAEFSRRTIFEPLGLRDTQWRDDYRRIVPRRATAYSRRGDGYIVDRPIEHVHGNGGLLTTIADLLTWNEALAAGTIGGAVFVEAMHRRGVLSDGTEIDYAAGISVGSYRDVREVSHTGATSGYRAVLLRYPDQQLGVAVLCNAGDVDPQEAGHALADIYLGDALAPLSKRQPSPAAQRERPSPSPGELAAYAGEYHSPEADARLVVAADEDGLVVRRSSGATLRLQPRERDVFDSPIGSIAFVRDDAGRVLGFGVTQPRVRDLRFDRVQGSR
jgi:CubicO group peptidase (beta-lactamase class C family)